MGVAAIRLTGNSATPTALQLEHHALLPLMDLLHALLAAGATYQTAKTNPLLKNMPTAVARRHA